MMYYQIALGVAGSQMKYYVAHADSHSTYRVRVATLT